MKKINEGERLPYTLVGVDGNAFSVMGYVTRAMRENGYSREECEAYRKEAMSSDYNNLLCVSIDMIDKINRESGLDRLEEAFEGDPLTFKRYLLRCIAKAIEQYQDEQEADVDPDDVVAGLENITANDIDNICGDYGINLHYNEEQYKKRHGMYEGEEYPDYDEADDLSLDVDNEFLRSKSLMPIDKNQRCLYIEAEDFESLGVDEETFIKFLEKETWGTSLEGIIWKDNVQLIINDEYKFNQLLDKMKEELHISRVDLQPYIYRADEMRPIIAASYKERYNH